MPEHVEVKENDMIAGLKDVVQKVDAALMPGIEDFVNSDDFDWNTDGLDFLEVKNSLLLSYLIELTYNVRQRISKKNDDEHFKRLIEMRTTLDKSRPLEKKMRYQLDKLLAASTTSASFAGGDAHQDPLTYRPDPNALKDDKYDDSSDDSDSDSDDDGASDDHAEAAKSSVQMSLRKGMDENPADGVYRAPRLASMPYPDEDDGGEERKKRMIRRLRTTELAQTLRAQYGDAPEQEDIHGGTDFGKQRDAARKMDEREAAKTRYEEESMVRLTTSRKDKKERQRLLREESSNLGAIADLGSLVRGVSAFQEDDSDDNDDHRGGGNDGPDGAKQRHSNGKRKRSTGDAAPGKAQTGRKTREAKNSFQQALYGKAGNSKKKKR